MDIKRIVVPVDYSDHAKETLRYAGALAARFGARLDVVHVWDRPSYVPETTMVSKPGEPARSLVELIRENAEREMSEFLASAALPESVETATRLESGEPASTIIEYVRKHEADLVVMGTRGRTGVKHLLLGSVAEKLVRLSPVPVLTIPVARGDE
ncbi:MAG: universal stress protein [Sorangiineae bacterium]|nr:universal stress protein [Polyangiaceae bacterium]MEB2321960.1 universal stress protein [Sorangiineae bacterium]